MPNKEEELARSLTAELEGLKVLRTRFQEPVLNFLRNDGTNWIDDEHIGQALLILMLSTSAKRFEKSSRRLEFLTWGLLGLTIALLVPTLVSVFR